MKIIIAGDGKLGSTLTRQLSAEDYDITLIDTEARVLEYTMEQYDVSTVTGNGAAMDTLREAGVEDADLLIAVMGSDEINMLCCMTAHGLNPKLHTIARIRDPQYAQQAYAMRSVFALSLIVNPERQAAREIERLIQYPGFLKVDTFAKGRVEIVELRIDEGSKLIGVPLSEIQQVLKCRVLVCAALRDGNMIAPTGSYTPQEGDAIFVTASTDNLLTLLRSLGLIRRRVRNVLLVGGGKLSFYLAQRLLKSGIDVEIIERDQARCVELADALPEANIIQGDASVPTFLEHEGLAQSDVMVTMTGLDELNILLSLYGTVKKVPQVITKVGRFDYNQIVSEIPLGSVVCPKELCCSTIVRYVRAVHRQTGAAVAVNSIAEGQGEAVEFIADEETKHVGEPLKNLPLRENILIAGITHGMQTTIPNGDSVFNQGDSVVVVTRGDRVLYNLNDIFTD